MFDVIYKDKVKHVYSVTSNKKGTYFLIYVNNSWLWVNCNECRLLKRLNEG